MDVSTDVTVVVSTFGHVSWIELAQARAIPSAQALGVPVIQVHGPSLHEARNAAVAQVTTPWVVHLDGDDELEPGFFKAMATSDADVRAPAVRYVRGGMPQQPAMPRVAGHNHLCEPPCLRAGNWLVVGAMVRTDLVRAVGGWRDFPWSEDWDLWLRCHLYGASIAAVPQAVYRAHVRPGSRNRGITAQERVRVHQEIARACGIT